MTVSLTVVNSVKPTTVEPYDERDKLRMEIEKLRKEAEKLESDLKEEKRLSRKSSLRIRNMQC